MLSESERALAIREGHRNAADASYFNERPHLADDNGIRVFDAGFDRGWDAACAERDARIAELEAANEAFGKRQEWWTARMLELEQQLAEARKDAMHEAALICEALPAPPSCNVLERSLWDVATVAAADAIRAAIKEQA